jgi:hypothetical protein
MATYEIRLRGNNPKFIDIMTKGAADSSGAVARIAALEAEIAEFREAANALRGPVAVLLGMHPDDLGA